MPERFILVGGPGWDILDPWPYAVSANKVSLVAVEIPECAHFARKMLQISSKKSFLFNLILIVKTVHAPSFFYLTHNLKFHSTLKKHCLKKKFLPYNNTDTKLYLPSRPPVTSGMSLSRSGDTAATVIVNDRGGALPISQAHQAATQPPHTSRY